MVYSVGGVIDKLYHVGREGRVEGVGQQDG